MGQKWRFKLSSDGGAGESWCEMPSSQTPIVSGFPRLKHEWIFPLSTHSLFQGNVKRFALGESTGMDFIAGIQVLGKQHRSAVSAAGKPGTAPSLQALF